MLFLAIIMPNFTNSLDNTYTIQIFDSITKIGSEKWNAIRQPVLFYQSYDFLETIERVQQDLSFRYVLIIKEQQIMTAMYVQLLHFSYKNLVNYNTSASNRFVQSFKQYIAKKNTRLMNLGNVFFTGDRGIICNNEDEIIPFIPQVFKHIQQSFFKDKPSAFLVSNIYVKDELKCIHFLKSNFHPFVTEPDLFLQIKPEWTSFDDYQNVLSSKYRVRAKKVLHVSADIKQKELHLEEIIKHKLILAKLYDNVLNHVAFNMAVLKVDFFVEMKSLYKEKCCMFGYYLKDELIGFAFLFNVDKSTLHVHYIGMDYDVNQQYKLYNRLLLDFVRYAIKHQKQQIHFGRTATEIKTTIGAKPQPLVAYLKMNNKLVNASLPYFLNRIKPVEYTVRSPFKEE